MLLISLVFLVTDYNRVALIVPIILLLTWPKLIEKKNLWLKVWFLTSFIHALYYPVFGAAVCIGFAPLGIWQIVTYAKSGQLLKDVKTVKFWILWIICFIPVMLGSGLLLGTVKHMLAMGSQTIYADGIARFGQELPENFMAYISNLSFRLIIYYLFSYLIMISIIWLSVALFLRTGDVKLTKFKAGISNPEIAFTAISIALMMLISFSYTVVRFDYYDIYSRSDGVIRASFVVLIILLARYVYKNNRNVLWIFAFTIFIISAVAGEGYLKIDSDEKLEAKYTVPEGYVYVANTEPRLGECFLEEDTYSYITRTNDYLNTIGKDHTYLGIVDSFGLYYLCNTRGDSAMEILNTIKGYSAVEETVEIIRANDTIVGMNISPLRNYYFYHWLVTSGDYYFDNDARLFYPNDGSLTKDEILQMHKNINLYLSTEAEEIGEDIVFDSNTEVSEQSPTGTEEIPNSEAEDINSEVVAENLSVGSEENPQSAVEVVDEITTNETQAEILEPEVVGETLSAGTEENSHSDTEVVDVEVTGEISTTEIPTEIIEPAEKNDSDYAFEEFDEEEKLNENSERISGNQISYSNSNTKEKDKEKEKDNLGSNEKNKSSNKSDKNISEQKKLFENNEDFSANKKENILDEMKYNLSEKINEINEIDHEQNINNKDNQETKPYLKNDKELNNNNINNEIKNNEENIEQKIDNENIK